MMPKTESSDSQSQDDDLRLALALGPQPCRQALSAQGDPRAAFEHCWQERESYHDSRWSKAQRRGTLLSHARRQLQRLARLGARALFVGTPVYPRGLLRLQHPPAVLFVQGRQLSPPGRCVAIVGSRAAFRRGQLLAYQLGAMLAGQGMGYTVVSGGALGIDAEAHLGCIEQAGSSIAVMGTGIDQRYPLRNRRLLDRMASDGAVVTQFPLGTPPKPQNFPQRNGLIAALSRLVVVVEARERSGALITARVARAIGVPVAAFHGSPGCDLLIINGLARPLRREADVLAYLRGSDPAAEAAPPAGEDEASLYALLAQGVPYCDAEVLALATGLSAGRVCAALLRMQLSGRILRAPDGSYRLT